MKNFIFFTLFCIVFAGCSDKKFAHEPLKNEFMAYTQKFESVKENDRYLAIASYLNPVFSEFQTENKEEFFLLNIYPKDETILPNSLKINGVFAKVEILDDNDPLIKKVAFNLPYSSVFKISVAKQNADNLVLSYETSNNLKPKFTFRKISKSLYWNPRLKF